jgi:general secretion pathway protein G
MIPVIAMVVVTNSAGIFSNSKESFARIQLELVAQQLEYYRMDMNNYPPTELGLSALRTQPTDPVGQSRWSGPYSMKVIPPDPWGNRYQYSLETDPISGENGYKIWSNGQSGQSNGDAPVGDDISVSSFQKRTDRLDSLSVEDPGDDLSAYAREREAEEQKKRESKEALEQSLNLFGRNVVRESQEFLDNTPLVKLFIGETITLRLTMHLKMADSYDTEVTFAGLSSEGVINASIRLIAESDPLGRKNVPMGSSADVLLVCKYENGAWKLKGNALADLISGLERKLDLNNESDEFEARMRSFERRIDSIANPTGGF